MPDLSRREAELVQRLRTPPAVQRFLNTLPYNFERQGETLRSFRGTLRAGRAHCLEAALVAAAIFERQGVPPLLLDLTSTDLLDHVIVPFRAGGRWGAVARSRDPGLHGRRPVFGSLEALAASYMLPYIDFTGRLTGFGVLDLRSLRADWRFSARHVWAVEDALNANRHQRLPTPEPLYREWHRRYLAYKARHPERRPVYYPNRKSWLTAGPR